MELKNKTIIVVSQEDWGKMFISKHHYAVELSKWGNDVYFLNSPDRENKLSRGEVQIRKTDYPGLSVIDHRFTFPYIIKFRARPLFNYLVRRHIAGVLDAIGKKVDLVWSFDLSNSLPLNAFRGVGKKVYMVADYPGKDTVEGADTADVILSTNFSDEFLEERFHEYAVPKKFISHGVADKFLQNEISEKINSPVEVGLSGNFLRADIDWDVLLEIIESNPEVIFNFWGAIDFKSSNLGYAEGEHLKKLEEAKVKTNTMFHGTVTSDELSVKLKEMDAFLICYDVTKDYSKGTNYHKVLEYLASGKVVVANNISSYAKHPDVLEMPIEKNNNSLPEIFSKVMSNLSHYNSSMMQERRITFAKGFTYHNNILKVEKLLKTLPA